MKIAIIQRFKYDESKDGIYYVTNDNVKMFSDNGITLVPVIDTKEIDRIVKECDGLCVPGGVDINPKLYNEENNGSETFYDFIDELDYAYIDAFHKANKPILGICRGHQIINVFFGGTLYQDIKDHRNCWHEVDVEQDGYINKIYNCEKLKVNSWHHQAVKDVAANFKVVARSLDGYVEAMQYENIYTVQWHPEMYDGATFIKYFIENEF